MHQNSLFIIQTSNPIEEENNLKLNIVDYAIKTNKDKNELSPMKRFEKMPLIKKRTRIK